MKATKTLYSISLMTALVALLALGAPAQSSTTDDRIEASAKKSYVFKTYLKEDDIKIESNDGAVTLTGDVSTEYYKTLAQETIADLPGVTSVVNKLEVKGEQPDEKSDGWLSLKVKTTLLIHRSVSAATGVDVKDGIVILHGEATSQAQKELTTEYARDVEGVKDVKNEMTLSKTPEKTSQTTGDKIDDSSITAQVKIALLLHRSTSALKTTVKTMRGVVTVEGKADNTAEKDLVTKLVKDVKGVNSVKNRMTVKERK